MAQGLGSFEKVLRVGEGRRLKRLAQQAAYIGTLEPEFEALSDDELRGKTAEFKQRIENGETLEEILFEAYGAVREAFRRTLGIRLFDVQLMAGIVLHEGDIAEQKTGEGKTFTAVQALYLNALSGRNVHLVTVNDYLAKRDSEWTRPVYEALGATVGAIQNLMPFDQRRAMYERDVTYGTNSEFGFDYLRDNMAVSLEGTVQKGHTYAIVDEVDSILIDEARTPLIISGEPETAAKTYYDFARVVMQLEGEPYVPPSKIERRAEPNVDYTYDEKFKTVSPLPRGIERVERALGIDNLYDPRNVQLVNHLTQALKAQALYHRDKEYVIQDGEVKIVDEFTGRIMEGRRWSEGLHQAVEAKENVAIQEEHVTMATITLQNYFRLYDKLAGMTGTAKTEEKEFTEIYGLHVAEIPTNVPVARDDRNDLIYRSVEAKFDAALDDIAERHEAGQPVLVGTIAVETSEYLSQLLTRRGIQHNVLNAKQHEREAEIIAQAGRKGAVTIATNMAGRGVDIVLGGNKQHEIRSQLIAEGFEEGTDELEAELKRRMEEARDEWEADHEEVLDLGGLYVVGTERHEARRIDNQLRGRSGRQGDPGETRFFLSGADNLVRLFAGDRIQNIMARFKVPEDQPMEAGILTQADRERAEEGRGAELRHAQERPQVRRRHEQAAHGDLRAAPRRAGGTGPLGRGAPVDRRDRRAARSTRSPPTRRRAGISTSSARRCTPSTAPTSSADELREDFGGSFDRQTLVDDFSDDAQEAYTEKERQLGTELLRELERYVILQVVDTRWREHLENMDYLREGVHLRAMAQKDPLVEYTSGRSHDVRGAGTAIREEVVFTLFHAELAPEAAAELTPQEAPTIDGGLAYSHESMAGADAISAAFGSNGGEDGELVAVPRTEQRVVAEEEKIGRNDPCWCGSGKKFKKCHGA